MPNTPSDNIRQQIADAIDQLPHLLEQPRATSDHNPVLSWMDPRLAQKRRWLWSGVSVFVVAIIGIWVVNTQTFFRTAKEQGFPEKMLIERAKADSEQLMNTVQARNDLERITAERKERAETAKTALQVALQSIIDTAQAAAITTTTLRASTSTSTQQ